MKIKCAGIHLTTKPDKQGRWFDSLTFPVSEGKNTDRVKVMLLVEPKLKDKENRPVNDTSMNKGEESKQLNQPPDFQDDNMSVESSQVGQSLELHHLVESFMNLSHTKMSNEAKIKLEDTGTCFISILHVV